jgi:hypothetical protein
MRNSTRQLHRIGGPVTAKASGSSPVAAGDLAAKSEDEIAAWMANHERLGQTQSPLYASLVTELARRRDLGLRPERSLDCLMQAAKAGRFVSFGELAEASGVAWSKARRAMSGPRGHLDKVMAICHARGLPLFPAIVVNKSNVETGRLHDEAVRGFNVSARRLGIVVSDEARFVRECQEACFRWGRAA